MNKQYYFLSITDLIIPKTAPYEETHAAINRFIDSIPPLVEKLADKIARGDFHNFTEIINDQVLPLIVDVNARVLEADAKVILRRIERTGFPSTLMSTFMSNLMTLSLKMQKAQNYGDEIEHVNSMQAHAEIIHALSSFITLIICGDFAEAQNMITEIRVFDEETVFMFDKLFTLTKVYHNYDEAKDVANELKEKHLEAIRRSAGDNSSMKVLAVDDMAESLSFVSNVLKDYFKVFRATSGKTALKVIEVQNIDLFILDIDMPEMNGYELAKKIRSNAAYAKTPIIFLTGNSTRDHITKAIQAGGNDFVIKPASYETLLNSVSKQLKR